MALELGPCQVSFGTAGAEVDLGKTYGGVVVKLTDDYVDLMSDQYGTAAEDTIITGNKAEVEISFAEIDFDMLALVLNQATFGTAPAGLTGQNNVGTSLLAAAASLELIKYVAGIPSTDLKNKIIFPKAAPLSNVELSYDTENQRVLKTTFRCYPSVVNAAWGTGTPNDLTVLYYFGDQTAAA